MKAALTNGGSSNSTDLSKNASPTSPCGSVDALGAALDKRSQARAGAAAAACKHAAAMHRAKCEQQQQLEAMCVASMEMIAACVDLLALKRAATRAAVKAAFLDACENAAAVGVHAVESFRVAEAKVLSALSNTGDGSGNSNSQRAASQPCSLQSLHAANNSIGGVMELVRRAQGPVVVLAACAADLLAGAQAGQWPVTPSWLTLVSTVAAGLSAVRDDLAACEHQRPDVQCMLDAAMAAVLADTEGAFNCPICMETLAVQDCFMASACGHRLCRSCAMGAVHASLDAQEVSVCPQCKACPCPRCPSSTSSQASGSGQGAKVDAAEAAEGEEGAQDDSKWCLLTQQDMQTLLPDDVYQRWLHTGVMRSVARGLFMRCPANECGEGVVMDEGEVHFVCPTCRFEFCTECGVPWHEGSTCDQYKQWKETNSKGDAEFDQFHRQHGAKACPSCKHAALKQDPHQCNKITCGMCKILFCWVCCQKITGYDHFNAPSSPCYGKLFLGCPGH